MLALAKEKGLFLMEGSDPLLSRHEEGGGDPRSGDPERS